MEFLHSLLAFLQRKLSWVSASPVNWKGYVQGFSWLVTLFESYLLLRQYPLYSKTEPPPALSNHFKPDVFAKSQAYGKDKARFSLVSGLFKQSLDSFFIQYGFYAWSWNLAGKAIVRLGFGPDYEVCSVFSFPIEKRFLFTFIGALAFVFLPALYVGLSSDIKLQITQSLFFTGILVLLSTIPTLPFSVYQTFVLEEKHGFNKTTPKTFITDILKGYLLGAVIGGPFLAAFLYVFKWAGDRFVPWLMGFMISFQMIMVIIYPTVIQPFFNKLSPLAEGDLRTRVETLAVKLKFPLKHLYEIDGSKRSSHSNAYFFGLPWSKHIVIFDTLIKESKPEEVEAVLAHELGHWYHLHPTKLLAFSQVHIFTILAMFPAFLHAPPLLRSFDFSKEVAAQPPTIVAFLLFQMLLAPLEAVVGIIMNAISRQFEWQADQFACELQDKLGEVEGKGMDDMGERLGKALVTLHVKNLSTVWVDWLYSAYHHSHPTLTERLKALESLSARRMKKE